MLSGMARETVDESTAASLLFALLRIYAMQRRTVLVALFKRSAREGRSFYDLPNGTVSQIIARVSFIPKRGSQLFTKRLKVISIRLRRQCKNKPKNGSPNQNTGFVILTREGLEV